MTSEHHVLCWRILIFTLWMTSVDGILHLDRSTLDQSDETSNAEALIQQGRSFIWESTSSGTSTPVIPQLVGRTDAPSENTEISKSSQYLELIETTSRLLEHSHILPTTLFSAEPTGPGPGKKENIQIEENDTDTILLARVTKEMTPTTSDIPLSDHLITTTEDSFTLENYGDRNPVSSSLRDVRSSQLLPSSSFPILSSSSIPSSRDQNSFLVMENSDAGRAVSASEGGLLASAAHPSRKTERKSKPDIQDIIDGIVKLLGGKVHVQAATEAAPSREPIRGGTRINNRGPPRITEVPFEAVPVETFSTRPSVPVRRPGTPQPPFQNGVPLPEQIVPPFIRPRPGLIPWARPRPRPPHTPPLLIPLRPPPPPDDTFNKHSLIKQEFPPKKQDISTTKQEVTRTKEDISITKQEVTPTKEEISPTKQGFPDPNLTIQEAPPRKQDSPPIKADFPSKVKENKDNKKQPVTIETDKNSLKPTAVLSNTVDILPQSSTDIFSSSADVYSSQSFVISPSSSTTHFTSTATTSVVSTATNEFSKTSILPSLSDFDAPTIPVLESSLTEQIHVSTHGIADFSSSGITKSETPKITTTSLPALETSSIITTKTQTSPSIIKTRPQEHPNNAQGVQISTRPSFHRPGMVFDDSPDNAYAGGEDVFEVTVSANQNFGGPPRSPTGKPYVIPVDIEDILTTAAGNEQFVSIDGKRTYFNLFPTQTAGGNDQTNQQATQVVNAGITFANPVNPSIIGTGYVVPEPDNNDLLIGKPQIPLAAPQPPTSHPVINQRPLVTRRPFRRPAVPPVRIDTCIVGDSTTCDNEKYETCRTEQGVSACVCRPGFGRRRHRQRCSQAVSLLISVKVDKVNDQRISWNNRYRDSSSEEYQQLEWEASHALDSAMGLTPMASAYLGSRVHGFYALGGRVLINATLLLEANAQTKAPTVKRIIQRHLLTVIQRKSNNIGDSALWVEGPLNPIPGLQDVNECSGDELHDCDPHAVCTNVFGSFRCACAPGYTDKFANDEDRAGRQCEACAAEYCNGRGECQIEDGKKTCHCQGSFYGAQCEVDGEVLGVALGASITAVVIIVLTLVCLCMWSRRWKREQQKTELLAGRNTMSPASYNYVSKGQGNNYHVTLEDRLRWAQIVDAVTGGGAGAATVAAVANAHAQNLYAPDPITRPSSAVLMGNNGIYPPPTRLPRTPVPFDEEDDECGGRGIKGPRSKSRNSLANQSGIYYDLDFEEGDGMGMGMPRVGSTAAFPIPMNTYVHNVGRPFYG